jgi:hypothetical protein
MIGGGYLIYIFPGVHFEPNFFPPLSLNRFLNSSKARIDKKRLVEFVQNLIAHRMIYILCWVVFPKLELFVD